MIEAVLIASLFCSGFYLLGHGDMILDPIRTRLQKLFTYSPKDASPKEYLIWKPIWGCPACMASLWGSGIWWMWQASFDTDWDTWLYLWLPAVIAIAFLNHLLTNMAKHYDT